MFGVLVCLFAHTHGTYYMSMFSVFRCFNVVTQFTQFPIQEADGVDCFGTCTHAHNKTITSLPCWEKWLLNYIPSI